MLSFGIYNAIGALVNLIVFCFNLWVQSKLRGRHRLAEATGDYWFRSIFVDEISKSIKSITEFHVSFWESTSRLASGDKVSFEEYLQYSLQTDFDGFISQIVVICKEFEHLPKSVVTDIASVVHAVDEFVTDKCNEFDTGNLNQDRKNRIKSEIVSRLNLLPSRILVVLMKAHRELVGKGRGR